jgi:hypothetical protein
MLHTIEGITILGQPDKEKLPKLTIFGEFTNPKARFRGTEPPAALDTERHLSRTRQKMGGMEWDTSLSVRLRIPVYISQEPF